MEKNQFDPLKWANMENGGTETSHPTSVNRPSEPASDYAYTNGDTDREQIQAVVDQLVARGIDITADYRDWVRVGFALVDGLGESGRPLFHAVSSMYPKYSYPECDKQYSACLRSSRGDVSIHTLFGMAKDAGVDVAAIAREAVSDKNDKNDNLPLGIKNTSDKGIKVNNMNVNTLNNNNINNINSCITLIKGDADVPSGRLAEVAEVAETSALTTDSGQTFSDKLNREDLCSFLQGVWDTAKDTVARDKLLLCALNVISGMLPETYYAIYDRRRVYAPLYNIICGPTGSSKGDLEMLRKLADPIRLEMKAKYDQEMETYDQQQTEWNNKPKKEKGQPPKMPEKCSPFVSANSSSSALYRGLHNNGGWGLIFDTESDTMTNMLNQKDYGDYSDLLRKAHHHEHISIRRVTENIDIEIENPRLAVFLTCTSSQLPKLLPADNVSNGLASRFLFYLLPPIKVVFRDVFENENNPLETVYKEMGEKLMPLYHGLLKRKGSLIQFMLNPEQKSNFLSNFEEMLTEQFSLLGEGIQGFIYRIALECFRYCMVLTALRRLSDWNGVGDLFDENEQALVCDERDFHTAITIIDCLVNHTGRVYFFLAPKDDDPFNNKKEQPRNDHRQYFEALPSDRPFKTGEAMEVAKRLNIVERSAMRILGKLVNQYRVLAHPRQGFYQKVKQHSEEE